MEKTEQEKFVEAVISKDSKAAYKHLEDLLKRKCVKKIHDTLNK